MKQKKKNIGKGVYLVLDPSLNRTELLEKLEQALKGSITAIQIWNHWPETFSGRDKEILVEAILAISNDYEIPVLINSEWELLQTTGLDGIHFDEVPPDYKQIKSAIAGDFISGITCGNDLNVIRWADHNDFDYISFCSMFPSDSVDSCEIVKPETVRKARELTDLPLFVSGGITPQNLSDLEELDFQGVAVISGIMNSESPEVSAIEYKQVLERISPFERGKERRSRSGG